MLYNRPCVYNVIWSYMLSIPERLSDACMGQSDPICVYCMVLYNYVHLRVCLIHQPYKWVIITDPDNPGTDPNLTDF